MIKINFKCLKCKAEFSLSGNSYLMEKDSIVCPGCNEQLTSEALMDLKGIISNHENIKEHCTRKAEDGSNVIISLFPKIEIMDD